MNVRDLVALGLPEECVPLLEARGFGKLTSIQELAVGAGVLEGSNVLAAAPTSSGKTLIGELVAAVNAGHSMTVYLVSHKALARQVFGIFHTRYRVEETPFLRAGLLTGDDDTVGGNWDSFDVVVSTYEKFYSTIATSGRLPSTLKAVVVDEVQHLGVEARGAPLELLIASLLREGKAQVVCLSATVPNAATLAGWLEAELVTSESRYPPLEQEIWVPNQRRAFKAGMDEPEILPGPQALDTGAIVEHLLKEGLGPVAVMATTLPAATKYVQEIAARMPVLDPLPQELIHEFRATGEGPEAIVGLDEALGRGVGIHTANLTPEQREVLEEAFAQGTIQVLVATPTLVAGVNLPIRTVVYPTLKRYNGTEDADIDVSEYVNGAGRAGRLSYCDRGTVVLVAESLARAGHLYRRFVSQEPEPITSQFQKHTATYRLLHILAMLGKGTSRDVAEFAAASLWGHEKGYKDDPLGVIELGERLDRLIERSVSKGWLQREDDELRLTPVGRAICASALEPEDATAAAHLLERHWSAVKAESPLTDENLARLLCCSCQLQAMAAYIPQESGQRRAHGSEIRKVIQGHFDGTPSLMESLGAGYLIAQSEVQVIHPNDAKGLMKDRSRRTRCAGHASRLFAVAAAIARCGEDLEQAAFHASQVSEALRLQVPLDAVPIAQVFASHRVRMVGRERTIRLAKEIRGELARVLTMEQTQLASAIGEAQVEGVRRAVLTHLDGLSTQQSEHQLRRAALLSEVAPLVEALFREQGTAFEPYVCKALNLLGWSLALVNQVGQESKPDLRGKTPDGRKVAVECKTRDTYDKEVSKREALDILKKVPEDSDEVLITVARPQFAFAGVQSAHASARSDRPVHLVTASAIVEAILTHASNAALASRASESFARIAHVDLQRFLECVRNADEVDS